MAQSKSTPALPAATPPAAAAATPTPRAAPSMATPTPRAAPSTFVKLATNMGYLTPGEAIVATSLIDEDPDNASQDILLEAGLLTADEAREVDAARKTTDMSEHLDDQFKRATSALVLDEAATARRQAVLG